MKYQCVITPFAYLFNQSACYYSFAHFSTDQRAITIFCIVYGTSVHHDAGLLPRGGVGNTGLIAHSSVELKYRY